MNKKIMGIVIALSMIIAIIACPKLIVFIIEFIVRLTIILFTFYFLYRLLTSTTTFQSNSTKNNSNLLIHNIIKIKSNPIKSFDQIVGYHGTPKIDNLRKAVKEGFKAGPRDNYGIGIYITLSLDEAKNYCSDKGGIFELHIDPKTIIVIYDKIPGLTKVQKYKWALNNNVELIFIKKENWLFAPTRNIGDIVKISGLIKVRALDHNGHALN